MKAKVKDKIRIINKMNDWSMDYKEGDIFTVESTWYGGVNVKSPAGIPLSLDEVEYEVLEENSDAKLAEKQRAIFHADSEAGVQKALDDAENLLKYGKRKGFCVELEILAEGTGIFVFRASSKGNEKIRSLQSEGIKFVVCQKAMEQIPLTGAELISGVKLTELGIAELVEKQSQGFAYIKV